jgi:hypothetical protein
VAGRAKTVRRERVAEVAERVLGRAPLRARVDDVRAEPLAAEAGVLVGLGPAQVVVHVERVDAVPERAEHVPERRRVGTAGDERDDLPAGRDQLVSADVLLDARVNVLGHANSVATARSHASVTAA